MRKYPKHFYVYSKWEIYLYVYARHFVFMNDPWFVILTLCHSLSLANVQLHVRCVLCDVRVMVCATNALPFSMLKQTPKWNHSKMLRFISSCKRSTNSIAHFRLPMNFHKRLESVDGKKTTQDWRSRKCERVCERASNSRNSSKNKPMMPTNLNLVMLLNNYLTSLVRGVAIFPPINSIIFALWLPFYRYLFSTPAMLIRLLIYH